ncbi:hypothetical protein ACFFJI_12725 [Allobacillus sp. GCM10007491]|uniref:hypothetical protein n=1 Tax=Allobacillus TaxID=1400133 RepID=UPI001F44CB57|nr:hypothetical protein [Allobacillus saliphilus]
MSKSRTTNYPRWDELPYAGESRPVENPEAPFAGSWTTYFIQLEDEKWVSTFTGETIPFQVRHPSTINWEQQLTVVQ